MRGAAFVMLHIDAYAGAATLADCYSHPATSALCVYQRVRLIHRGRRIDDRNGLECHNQ